MSEQEIEKEKQRKKKKKVAPPPVKAEPVVCHW